MKFENIDWGDILEKAGAVATVFNPAIGSGLVVASNVADKLQGLDDSELENNVIGLTRSSEILDNMIENKNIDEETLKMLSSNLRSLETILSKTAKVLR